MLELNGPHIPMTPNKGVLWEAINLENGTLYVPGQDTHRDSQITNLLKHPPTGVLLDQGANGGKIYLPPPGEDQNVVIKEFNTWIINGQWKSEAGNLSVLRANIMMETGLGMLDQSHETWRIQGAAVLGALVFNATDRFGPALRARWVMERIHPVVGVKTRDYMSYSYPTHSRVDSKGNLKESGFRSTKTTQKPPLPPRKKRTKLYDQAMAATGASPGIGIFYDDHYDNMLLERIAEKHGPRTVVQGIATKIDVGVWREPDFNF